MFLAATFLLLAQSQKGDQSFLAHNTLAKPNLKHVKQFTIPAPEGHANYHSVKVKFPANVGPGKEPQIFVGKSGAFVSVHIELEGEDAKAEVLQALLNTELRYEKDKKVEGLVVAGDWFGHSQPYKFKTDSTREGQMYILYRGDPYVVYTMLGSWKIGDRAAKKEAADMASYVIWTAQSGAPKSKP